MKKAFFGMGTAVLLFGITLPAEPANLTREQSDSWPETKIQSTLENHQVLSVSSNLRTANNQSAIVDPSECKLQEYSYWRNLAGKPTSGYTGNATAFPFNPTSLPIIGEINVAFIYVDWIDLPGKKSDYRYYKKQLRMFKDFYAMVSENKLVMNTKSSKSWFRISGSYKDYSLTQDEEAQMGSAPRKQVFYDAAVAASDYKTDFSDVDIVFFGIPRAKSVFFHGGPHEFNWNYNGSLKTSEGEIFDTATAGDWFLKNDFYEPPWVYYVHETGHMIGVPHQSNEDFKDGRLIHLNNPLSGYDIMANQGGASRTINSWLRWLAGWLDDEQVICTTKESITDNSFTLHRLNEIKNRVESVVIRLSDSKAVVIESRRFDKKFDRKTLNSKRGLIVYLVDANKSSAQGSQALLSPRDITKYIDEPTWRSGYELDAVFFEGDSVVMNGIRIEAERIGKKFDVVRISKVS